MAQLPAAPFSEWTVTEIEELFKTLNPKLPSYPAGTTLEEAIANRTRMSGEQAVPTDFVTICDVCHERIPEVRTFVESTHKCSGCNVGFDLCHKCASDPAVNTARCPKGYGCGEGAITKEEYPMRCAEAIFVAIQERLKPRVFTIDDMIEWAHRVQFPNKFSSAA